MHTKEEPQKVYARRYSPRLKDRPVVLNFGKNGRVYSGLGYKEAGPIEDRLRDEYPGLFRNGFRFAMNCENDNRKIRKAMPKGITKEPRIAAMRGIMMARSKPVRVFEPSGISSMTQVLRYEKPAPRAACKFVDPENPRMLVDLLQNEAKVI